MNVVGKIKEIFEEESGDHDAPEHKVADGHLKSWSADDLADDELVDDDWIRRHTKEVE